MPHRNSSMEIEENSKNYSNTNPTNAKSHIIANIIICYWAKMGIEDSPEKKEKQRSDERFFDQNCLRYCRPVKFILLLSTAITYFLTFFNENLFVVANKKRYLLFTTFWKQLRHQRDFIIWCNQFITFI